MACRFRVEVKSTWSCQLDGITVIIQADQCDLEVQLHVIRYAVQRTLLSSFNYTYGERGPHPPVIHTQVGFHLFASRRRDRGICTVRHQYHPTEGAAKMNTKMSGAFLSTWMQKNCGTLPRTQEWDVRTSTHSRVGREKCRAWSFPK